MTYIYYIPHASFFSKHPYGRVAHAIGVANGIAENGHNVILVAESGVELFQNRLNSKVKLQVLKKFSFFAHILFIIQTPLYFSQLDKNFIFIYRKTVLSLFLIPFLHLLNIFKSPAVISEVNGFIFDYKKGFKSSFLTSLTELFHKTILRFDTYIYTVNDDIKNILSSGFFSISPQKIISIHNGGPQPNFLNFKKKSDGIIKLIFFGILADYNEIELFVDVLERPKLKGKVELEIVGFGPQLEIIKRYSENRPDISIYGKMSFEDFSILLRNWDCRMVGIVPMRMGNKLGSLSPIKAFDYMSFALPLIYSDLCLDGLVENKVHGFKYKNGDIDSLEITILEMLKDENFWQLSENVKNDYYLHTWKERMKILIKSTSL